MPAILIAFSSEECVCDDTYATSFCLTPVLFDSNFVARSRAAITAVKADVEAVS